MKVRCHRCGAGTIHELVPPTCWECMEEIKNNLEERCTGCPVEATCAEEEHYLNCER